MTSCISGSRFDGVAKWVWSIFALLSFVARVQAGIGAPGDPFVGYNPATLQTINIEVGSAWPFALSVTSPEMAPPATVTLQLTVIDAPDGVTDAVASSYVVFQPAVLSFTGPLQTKSAQVFFSLPAGAVSGKYQYKITTTGWANSPVDEGTFINMYAVMADELKSPGIHITEPSSTDVIPYVPGLTVPIRIECDGTQDAPILSVEATISRAGDASMQDVPLALAKTGLGTIDAHGVVTQPIAATGTYTIKAKTTNAVGSSVTVSQFVVAEGAAPPTLLITAPVNNPTYTYVRGVTTVAVPYSFTATSFGSARITGLTAILDDDTSVPIAVAFLNKSTATETGSFTFSGTGPLAPGDHILTVTVTDSSDTPQGTAGVSATTTFTVVEQVPVITGDITSPQDNATIQLPPDASPLNVPFNFTSAVTLGGTVKTISAVLAGAQETVLTVIPTGLNTPAATGSGVMANLTPGTYTLSATAENSDLRLTAADSVTFKVVAPPPPTIDFTQAPQANYPAVTGYGISVPFAIKTTGTGAYITTQSVTLGTDPVTFTSTANGTSLTATGTGTLSIPAVSVAGTTTYTLTATGTDAYGNSDTAEVTFTVTASDPVIAISINSQIAANSPYVLPASGGLSIPFTFTGTITPGATVDTITGDLGGSPVTISSSTGLGTSTTATASGTMTFTNPGTYTLTATDTNTKSGASATASVSFVVTKPQAPPPLTIAITQAPLPTYTILGGCNPVSIPITFVGSSNGGLVKTLTATLDGQPITLSSVTGLNTATATGKATLSVRTAGTHVLVVKTTDNYNQTATTSTSFVVVVQKPEITVVIDKPVANAVYTLPAGSGCDGTGPLSIPFSFTSTITPGATIDAISATLNGCSVSVTKSGVGTATAKGSGTLTVTKTGTYTFTAKGVDTGSGVSATKSVTFTVRKAAAPKVTITAPTQTTYTGYSNCSPVSVAFAFKGVSESGGITKLSATLDGQYLTVTKSGIGALTATGSGTMALKSAGKHVLTVSASDANGSSSTSLTLNLTVSTPTPTVTIAQPVDGAVFTYEDGSPLPAIPFVFNASTNSGATITSLKASLNNNCVDITNTGIGTSAVKGTGTLKVCGAGTYTLMATAVSGGVNATAKVTFTVKKLPAPTSTAEWSGSICDGKTKTGGYSVKTQFKFRRQSASGSSYLRDTSVKVVVCEERNGYDADERYYGSSSYSIDSANCYNLNVPTSWGKRTYRVEVYYFVGNTPKLLGSKTFKTK